MSQTSSERNGVFSEHVRRMLARLTPREEKVIRMRHGIGEEHKHSLEEIALTFCATHEDIRAIELRAIKKLCHPPPILN